MMSLKPKSKFDRYESWKWNEMTGPQENAECCAEIDLIETNSIGESLEDSGRMTSNNGWDYYLLHYRRLKKETGDAAA